MNWQKRSVGAVFVWQGLLVVVLGGKMLPGDCMAGQQESAQHTIW